MSLNIVDILLIIGMSQGLFLALTIQLLPNKNKEANTTLAIALVIASLSLFARSALIYFQSKTMLRLGILADSAIYIFGPYLYSYIRQLTFKEKPKYHLAWYHYVPVLLNIIYFIWSFTHSLEELQEMVINGQFNTMYFVVELGGIISVGSYFIMSLLIVNKFKRLQKIQVSFHQIIVRYLYLLLIAIGSFVTVWLITFIGLYGFHYYSKYINYTTMWFVALLFIYFIGYFSLTQPTIFRMPLENKVAQKTKKNRLKPEEIELLKEKLNTLIIQEQVYTIPDISLKGLSEQLNTTSNNLSWLLNHVYHKTFYEYINQFRVEDFLKKIENKQHQNKTLLAVAMDAGFNSKSTFNKAFKTLMHDTPSNYIKNKGFKF